jgi:hypothetical protein
MHSYQVIVTNMKTIITLQNGKKLNERQFINYFERKILYTIRKYDLFVSLKNSKTKKGVFTCPTCLPKIEELLTVKKIGNISISRECTDDIALQVLEAFMEKGNIKKELNKLKLVTILNKKKIIRPFYLMKKEEILIYAKTKGIVIKGDKTKKSLTEKKIDSWVSELEKTHLEIKNAIVNSLLKIEEVEK